MRQSENKPKTAQAQFNIATDELFSQFGYKDIKPVIDDLLLGWISSDYFDLKDTSHKTGILDFFNRSLIFLEKASQCYYKEKDEKEIAVSIFSEILSKNFDHNYNDIKKYLKITLKYYLQTEFSNDNLKRSDTIYKVKQLKKYFKKIYKIKTECN